MNDPGAIEKRFPRAFSYISSRITVGFRGARTAFRDYGQQTRLSRTGRSLRRTVIKEERHEKEEEETEGEKQRDGKEKKRKEAEGVYNTHHPDATVQL